MKLPQWLSWLPIGDVPATSPSNVNQNIDSYLLVDVRSDTEFKKSHIPGAISIPLYKLTQTRISNLPTDKPIICICLSAHRSKPATRKLIEAGFDARELEGGMLAWWGRNFPTEKFSG